MSRGIAVATLDAAPFAVAAAVGCYLAASTRWATPRAATVAGVVAVATLVGLGTFSHQRYAEDERAFTLIRNAVDLVVFH